MSVTHTLNLTWDSVANGAPTPRLSNTDFYLGGVQLRYYCLPKTEPSKCPHQMFLELLTSNGLEDFDDHFSITIKNPKFPNYLMTFNADCLHVNPYNIPTNYILSPDEWILVDFDVHAFRGNFVSKLRAVKCGNDYGINLTQDNGHVWVNCELMSADSEFFRQQLLLPANSKRMKLEGVKTADFLEYVYCVHPPVLKLSLDRVGRVAKLARRFENGALIERCRDFLRAYKSEMPAKQCQHLVELNSFGMFDAFEQAVNDMKDCDLKLLAASSIQTLSRPSLQLLLKRLTSPCGFFLYSLLTSVYEVTSSFGNLLLMRESEDEGRFSYLLDVDEATKRGFDCTILVEGHEESPIYVKKSILAMQSDVFKNLFSDDFKSVDSDTLLLKTIDFNDFLEYLLQLYVPNPPLTMTTVGAVMGMAEKFQNQVIFEHCSKFLRFKADKTGAEKQETLYLADRFNLEELFKMTLGQLRGELSYVNAGIDDMSWTARTIHEVNISWNVTATGERINPRFVEPTGFRMGGLEFQYKIVRKISFDPKMPYKICLVLTDAAVNDFDHHWAITIKHASGVSRIFKRNATRHSFYDFDSTANKCEDEWTLIEFDAFFFRTNFTDASRAAKCGFDYQIDLIEDNGRVWVSGELLIADSEYFREELNHPENFELALEGVKTEDFLDYAYCVHPPALKLSLARVSRVSALARRFENQALISSCEKFLETFQSEDPSQICQYLIEADRHGLDSVFALALHRMNHSSLKLLDMSAVFEFSEQNLRLVLERLIRPPRWFFSPVRIVSHMIEMSKSLFSPFSNLHSFNQSKVLFLLDIKAAASRNFDCTILIEGHESKPIYVKKSLLVAHSDYFKALFFGSFIEAGMDTITMKKIDFGSFLEYVASIYSNMEIYSNPITLRRVFALLRMADQFQNGILFQHCSDFLLNKANKSVKEKVETLCLADEFGFDDIFAHGLEELDRDSIESLNVDVVIGFGPENLKKLLERCHKCLYE